MITIKNYKKLEGRDMLPWRDFAIQSVTEEEKYYEFKVLENRIPYIIRLQRENAHGANSKNYHWIKLFDGNGVYGYLHKTIRKEEIQQKEKIMEVMYRLVVEGKPKAQPVNGNRNFNSPF